MSDRGFTNDIDEEVERFKRYLEGEKKSENTIREYSYIVRMMLIYLKRVGGEITEQDLTRFKIYLSTRKKYSKNSLYLAVEAINTYLRYRGKNLSMKPPRRPKSMPRYLSEEEVKKLLDAARDYPRDYAILSLLAYSGLRVSELCNLKIEDIDLKERIVYVRSGKGDKDRIVVVSHDAVSAVENYLSMREDALRYLFSSQKSERITRVQVFRIVKKYAKIAGIRKNVTPHVLRHTLATTLLKRGVDIRFIQQFLGHSSVATTQIYTHVNDEMLRNVYDRVMQEY